MQSTRSLTSGWRRGVHHARPRRLTQILRPSSRSGGASTGPCLTSTMPSLEYHTFSLRRAGIFVKAGGWRGRGSAKSQLAAPFQLGR
eukprot:4838018-Pyramimonas_sp.AAC.2